MGSSSSVYDPREDKTVVENFEKVFIALSDDWQALMAVIRRISSNYALVESIINWLNEDPVLAKSIKINHRFSRGFRWKKPLPGGTPPPPLVREDGYEIHMDKTVLDSSSEQTSKTAVDRNKEVTGKQTGQNDIDTNNVTASVDQTNSETKKDTSQVDQIDNTESTNTASDVAPTVPETKKDTIEVDQTNYIVSVDGEENRAGDAILPNMMDAFPGDVPYLVINSEYHGLDGRYVAVQHRSADEEAAESTAEDVTATASKNAYEEDVLDTEERERFGGFRYKRLLVVADSDDLDTATAIEQYFELLAVETEESSMNERPNPQWMWQVKHQPSNRVIFSNPAQTCMPPLNGWLDSRGTRCRMQVRPYTASPSSPSEGTEATDVPASELSMAQLSHWAGRYSDTLTQQTYHIELREDEFEDIVVLEISGRDTEPIDEWTGTGKVLALDRIVVDLSKRVSNNGGSSALEGRWTGSGICWVKDGDAVLEDDGKDHWAKVAEASEVALSSSMGEKDWQSNFESALRLYPGADKDTAVSIVYQSFKEEVQQMAMLLLREQFLPKNRCTLDGRLRDLTGRGWLIRGVHYSVVTPTSTDGTLANFPRFCSVYEYASKAAALQLKGCEACFDLVNFAPLNDGAETSAHEDGFALPMVAYVDFLGFRVLAQSVLPIINSHDFSSTLLLGSPDGGQSFTDLVGRIDPDTHDAYRVLGKEDSTLDGDPETRGRLQALGEQLGLAPHSVGALGFRLQQKRTKSKKKKVQEFEWVLHERKYTVYLGANVQVHKSERGQLYLHGLSCLMPPESPGFSYLYNDRGDAEQYDPVTGDETSPQEVNEGHKALFSSRVRVQGRHQGYDAFSFRRLRPEFVRALSQPAAEIMTLLEPTTSSASANSNTSKLKARLENDLYLAKKQISWGFAGPGAELIYMHPDAEAGLSADSFTKFARVGGSSSTQLEVRLHRATAQLLTSRTEAFARAWCRGLLGRVQELIANPTQPVGAVHKTGLLQQWLQFERPAIDLCAAMHRHGLNLRHLGLVLKAMDKHLVHLQKKHEENQMVRENTFSRQVGGLGPQLEIPTRDDITDDLDMGNGNMVESAKDKRARKQLLWEERCMKVRTSNANRKAKIEEWKAKDLAAAELEQDMEAAAVHGRWWLALEICCRALKHVWKGNMRNSCFWQQQVNLKELCKESAEFLNEKVFQPPSDSNNVFWKYPGGTLDYHIRLRFGSAFRLLPSHLKSITSLYDYIKHTTRSPPVLSPKRHKLRQQQNSLRARGPRSKQEQGPLRTRRRRSRHDVFLTKLQRMTGIHVQQRAAELYVLPGDVSLQPLTTTPALLDYSMGLRLLHEAEQLLSKLLTGGMDDKWTLCGRYYRRSLEQLQAVARRRSEMVELVEHYELRVLRGRLQCWLATHKAQKVVIRGSQRLDIVGIAPHPPYLGRLLALIQSTAGNNCDQVVTLLRDSLAVLQLDVAATLWHYARDIWPKYSIQLAADTTISLLLNKLSGDTERIGLHLRTICLAKLPEIDRIVSAIPQSRSATCLNISFANDHEKFATPKQQAALLSKDDTLVWTAVATLYFVPPRVRTVRWPDGGMGATVNTRLMESVARALLCAENVATLDVRGSWMSSAGLQAAAAINPAVPDMVNRSLSDQSEPEPPVYSHARTLQYHRGVINCIACMDDGTLAVASRDKSLSLWRSGRLVRVLKGHEHCVTALVSLPNGTLASGDFKGTIKFWRQGRCVGTIDSSSGISHSDRIHCFHLVSWPEQSNNDPEDVQNDAAESAVRLVSASSDNTVKVWRAGASTVTIGDASQSKVIHLWKEAECVLDLRGRNGHKFPVSCLASLSEGYIVSAGFGNAIKVWGKEGSIMGTLTGHEKAVTALAVFEDDTLASGSADGTVRLWRGRGCKHVDSQTKWTCLNVVTGHTKAVTSLVVLANGLLASGSYDGQIQLSRNGERMAFLEGHSDSVFAMIALPDGSLVSGSTDKTLRIWRDGECVSVLQGHAGTVSTLLALADGSIVSGSWDASVRYWW